MTEIISNDILIMLSHIELESQALQDKKRIYDELLEQLREDYRNAKGNKSKLDIVIEAGNIFKNVKESQEDLIKKECQAIVSLGEIYEKIFNIEIDLGGNENGNSEAE